MIVFLAALCVVAPLLILIVNPFEDFLPLVSAGIGDGGMREFNVLPRLAATAVFTGGALLWGAVTAARNRWPAGRWPASLWVPLAAFVAVNILVIFFAADWRFSLMGEHQRYQGLATALLYVLLFGVTAVAVRTARDLRLLLLALFVGALGTAIYGLVQEIEVLREGRLVPDAGPDWIPWTGVSLDRPFGTMGQANVQGAFLVAVVSAVMFLVVTAKERWEQVALVVGVVAMLASLFFTVSRSAYLAGGMVVLIWGLVAVRWLHQRVREPGQRAALTVIGAAMIAAPFILALAAILFIGLPQGRVAVASSANDRALDQRLSLWRLSLEMVADRPLLGYGHDGMSVEFPAYRDSPDLPGIHGEALEPESSHNFFLDLASGTGVLGLLAFLALLGAVFWHAVRRARTTDDAPLRLALLALGSGVLGYLAAVFFGFMESTSGWVFWLLLGAMAGLVADVRSEPEQIANEERNPEGRRKSRQERRREERERRKRQREVSLRPPNALALNVATLVLSLLGTLALVWAAVLIAADVAAGQGADAASRGDHDVAARLAGRAVTLNPLQRAYLFEEARAQETLALRLVESPEEEAALREAVAKYEELTTRFQPEAKDMLSLASAKLKLSGKTGSPVEQIVCPATGTRMREEYCDIERAIQLDYYNVTLHLEAARLYEIEGNDLRAYQLRSEAYCWGIQCE